ncbi:hypothetical protein EON81_26975 [bacterium]|nr:MAG: hypothetical protein EON81_26975 [bacterium]
MNRALLTRIAAVAIPGVLALILIILAVVQRNRFIRDTVERQQVEAQIAGLLRAMDEQMANAPTKVAAIPEDALEESTYLTFLRSSAAQTNVQISRWTADTRPTDTIKTPASPALAGIMALSGKVEISGNYRALLAFARRLEEDNRLYSLSTLMWNRAEGTEDVRLTTQITRYVFVATAPPLATP